MPTIRQKKVARTVVKSLESGKPMTAGEIVESSGYGPSMKKNPQVVMNSIGVREELAALGFSIEEADRTVAHLLKNAEKEETQIKAAQEIYKRLSAYAPEKTVNVNIDQGSDDRLDALIAKIEDGLDNPEGQA